VCSSVAPRKLHARLLCCGAKALLALALAAATLAGSYLHWYFHRPLPQPLSRRLHPGVDYQRRVEPGPPAQVFHLLRIRLDTPGLEFLVTPAEPASGQDLRAQTVSTFLERHDLQVAINGDYFKPWHSRRPWDYYPHQGDPVSPLGFAASSGEPYGGRPRDGATLFFSCEQRPSFRRPARLCNAISGSPLIRQGRIREHGKSLAQSPRTVVALNRQETELIILVVDGRQPNYSAGVTMAGLARMVRAAGGHNAVNLDGGGSSALVVGHQGEALVLNSPIHCRIPGWERPVANHMGIRIRRD